MSPFKCINHKLFSFLLIVFVKGNAFCQYFDCDEELFPRRNKETKLYGYVNFIGEERVAPNFIKAFPFQGKNAIVMQGKQYGILDCKGILVVPPSYDLINSFFDGKGWAKKNDLWALIDNKGRQLIAPTYNEAIDVSDRSLYTWVRKNDQWGLISKENGRFIVPLEYDLYSDMSDSAGILRKGDKFDVVFYGDGRKIYQNIHYIKKITPELYIFKHENNKWGVITSLAYTLIRPLYDSIAFNQGFFQVKSNNKCGLLNLKGIAVLPVDYEFIGPYYEGLCVIKKNNLYGFATKNGLVHISPQFDFAERSCDFISIAKTSSGTGLYDVKNKKWSLDPTFERIERNYNYAFYATLKNSQYSLISTSFKPILLDRVDSILLHEDAPFLRLKFSSGWTYFNPKTLSLVTSKSYSKIKKFSLGYGIVSNSLKWGVIDAKGNEIVPIQYDQVEIFLIGNELFFKVTQNGKKGLVSVNNQSINTISFDELYECDNKFVKFKRNGKFGFMDSKGNVIAEPNYDHLSNALDNSGQIEFPSVFKKGKKAGLLTNANEIIFEKSNTDIKYLGNGIFSYTDKEKFGLINQNGKLISEAIYDSVQFVWGKFIPVKQNDSWGFSNTVGRMTIPFKFESIKVSNEKTCFVKESGKWGGINQQGKYIAKPIFNFWYKDADGLIKLKQ